MNKCAWHLCNNETVINKRNERSKFCNQKCKNKYYVDRKRKDLKRDAVNYKGGKCEYCGYIGHPSVYDFHHKNPLEKDFGISHSGYTRSWDKVREEIDKCLLLCANCHREEHAKSYLD